MVGEQELGLRQMLRTMGMLDSAYWLSWMLFEVQICVTAAGPSVAAVEQLLMSFSEAWQSQV